MSVASKYWRLVRLTSSGKSKIEEIPAATAFFQQQFSAAISDSDLPIQHQLVKFMRQDAVSLDDKGFLAELCLRCFISNQIQQVCMQLEAQFGQRHGFTQYDLLLFVLDDDGKNRGSDRSVFAHEVLQSFDPGRSNLSTWTTRLVKHHRELNAFLLNCGVYLLSDWAILNDTSPQKLERVFAEFYPLTSTEVQQAKALLESYHAIYRQVRLEQRQAGTASRQCLPPTPIQLRQISQSLYQKTALTLSPDAVMVRLQTLTDRLRQCRIAARGGVPASESLDVPEIQARADQFNIANPFEEADSIDFLQTYRYQFIDCLNQALEQVVGDRLQTIKPPKDQHFLIALQLFHCRGLSMTKIAPQIGLKAQFEVTRLLKLNEFRADVRQWLLKHLRVCVADLAVHYVDPDWLQHREAQIEAALSQQVEELIEQAQAEAKTPKDYISGSLFARSLCNYLDRFVNTPFLSASSHGDSNHE